LYPLFLQTGFGCCSNCGSRWDAPGTILKYCSPEFIELFQKAELIISKGQGNYESLSEEDKSIFFLFKAKCPVIAKDIGCEVGDMVLKGGWE